MTAGYKSIVNALDTGGMEPDSGVYAGLGSRSRIGTGNYFPQSEDDRRGLKNESMMRDYQGFQWEHWPAADTIDGKDRPKVSAIGGSDLGLDVHLLDRLTSCELPRLHPLPCRQSIGLFLDARSVPCWPLTPVLVLLDGEH